MFGKCVLVRITEVILRLLFEEFPQSPSIVEPERDGLTVGAIKPISDGGSRILCQRWLLCIWNTYLSIVQPGGACAFEELHGSKAVDNLNTCTYWLMRG